MGNGNNRNVGSNYRIASQIYEAKDLTDFKDDEIIELLGINKKVLDYAIAQRNKIEPKLIRDLKIIYGAEDIKTPYRDLSKLQ